MLDDFLVRATLAGIGLALAAAPLGCFVVWRRMAFYGDATAHAAILGAAMAVATGLPVIVGVLVVALGVAFAVNGLNRRGYAADTLLAVLSHGALAFGLVAVGLVAGGRIDVDALLFGDILAVSRGDLVLIWGGGAMVLGLLIWRWAALLTSTLSPELAWAGGMNPAREQVVLTLALAVVVAVAIKVVGALLIAAILVIPAAAARPLARTPEAMALGAAAIGVGAVCLGMLASFRLDTQAGPSIACAAAILFAATNVLRAITGRARG